jgi:hypothetical protein
MTAGLCEVFIREDRKLIGRFNVTFTSVLLEIFLAIIQYAKGFREIVSSKKGFSSRGVWLG